ncbi:transcriptional regulator family: DDT [Salix suchowensis]|nr:transcriptional regulator family: DDT [Salix suchowensis]
MPTCRRKRVVLTQPADELLDAVKNDPHKEVFYLEQTGRFSKATSKPASPCCLATTHSVFSSSCRALLQRIRRAHVLLQAQTIPMRVDRQERTRLLPSRRERKTRSNDAAHPLLRASQTRRAKGSTMAYVSILPLSSLYCLLKLCIEVMGRLDHLVEAVYDRFKDRYFQHESTYFRLHCVSYYARVERVYPPKYYHDVDARDAFKPTDLTSNAIMAVDDEQPHVIAGDLNLPIKEANQRDDPTLYYYWVHILELEKDKPDKNRSAQQHEKDVG